MNMSVYGNVTQMLAQLCYVEHNLMQISCMECKTCMGKICTQQNVYFIVQMSCLVQSKWHLFPVSYIKNLKYVIFILL